MRPPFLALLQLLFLVAPHAQAATTSPNDTLVLTVNITVQASAHHPGGPDTAVIKDELAGTLTETVEYRVVSDDGNGVLGLERVGHSNRLSASGGGSSVSISGGVESRQDWTYAIDPHCLTPNGSIMRIDAGSPHTVQIGVGNFFADCKGRSSGTMRYATGWSGGGPTYETAPAEAPGYAPLVESWLFQSPEDMQRAAQGQPTALSQKLHGTYTPREDGGFYTSGNASHTYHTTQSGMIMDGSVTIAWTVQRGNPQKPEPAEITLEGCSELLEGGQGVVTARARTSGGAYRFWSDPETMFALRPQEEGRSVDLRGTAPGSGTLHVDYTSPEGKTAQASQAAACIRVESYNQGQAIPHIALFDAEGKRTSGILDIPVTVLPASAASRLEYVPANPGVLTAVNRGETITLQGIREGRTRLQAKTNCQGPAGPVVTVEVVACDAETIAQLEREMRAARDAQQETTRKAERILNSKAFQNAADNIGEATGTLITKTGTLIIGTLAAKGATPGAKTASEIIGVGSNLTDIMKGGDTLTQANNFLQLTVTLGGNDLQQAIAGAIETLQAATEFGTHLGTLMATARQLEELARWTEHWNRVAEDIARRQQLCRKGTGQPQAPSQPKGTPSRPGPKKPQATSKPPVVASEPPANPDVPNERPPEQPPGEGTEISPPAPTTPPRQVGLPYTPGTCGCGSKRPLGTDQTGIASLQTGLANLATCVDSFSSGPLSDYLRTLHEWTTVAASLNAAALAGPETVEAAAKEALPRVESLLARTRSFDQAGQAFLKQMQTCPEATSAGADVLQSAKNTGTPSDTGK